MTEIMRGGPQGWTALGLWAASRPEKNVDAPLQMHANKHNHTSVIVIAVRP
jgi:hypothetical protein